MTTKPQERCCYHDPEEECACTCHSVTIRTVIKPVAEHLPPRIKANGNVIDWSTYNSNPAFGLVLTWDEYAHSGYGIARLYGGKVGE